jgi:hypothetical protein
MLRIHDAILNCGAFGLLMTGLAAIDSDIRRHLMNMVAGDSMTEMAIVTAPVDRVVRMTFATMRDYQTDNGALFAFAVAAIVLFAFLFKS